MQQMIERAIERAKYYGEYPTTKEGFVEFLETLNTEATRLAGLLNDLDGHLEEIVERTGKDTALRLEEIKAAVG